MDSYYKDTALLHLGEGIPVANLELSVRAYNVCIRTGHEMVEDFIGLTTSDILHFRGAGKKSVDEILTALADNYNIIPLKDGDKPMEDCPLGVGEKETKE